MKALAPALCVVLVALALAGCGSYGTDTASQSQTDTSGGAGTAAIDPGVSPPARHEAKSMNGLCSATSPRVKISVRHGLSCAIASNAARRIFAVINKRQAWPVRTIGCEHRRCERFRLAYVRNFTARYENRRFAFVITLRVAR